MCWGGAVGGRFSQNHMKHLGHKTNINNNVRHIKVVRMVNFMYLYYTVILKRA